MDWDSWEHMLALEREIEYLRTLLRPEDTGHIRTAIDVLECRVQVLARKLGLAGRDWE